MDDIWVTHELGKTALNDASRTAVDYDLDGVDSARRAYTAEEEAAADERALLAGEQENREIIEDNLLTALSALQAIIDTPDATIQANPQTYIKAAMPTIRRIIRLLINALDGTS